MKEIGRACSTHRRVVKCSQYFGYGRRQLGRPGHRWNDNIRINIREIGWEVVDWTCPA
jgi:hypothetical protein